MPLTAPRQTVFVTSRSHIELMGKEMVKDNITTCNWHMPVSLNPLQYAISIRKKTTTHALVKRSKAFAVQFIGEHMKDAAIHCRQHTGAHHDKFDVAKLRKKECVSIDCPRIEGAVGNIECEVITEHDCGDYTLFIGKVLHKEMGTDEKRLFHIEKDQYTTTKD